MKNMSTPDYDKQARESLRLARIESGLSQRELSELSGISRDTIANLESGRLKIVSLNMFMALAEALGLQASVSLYRVQTYM